MTRPRLEVADVFRRHGDAFLDRYGDALSPEQRRALRDITACRTAALGGHVEECDRCGHRQIAYNSCRNRHCPKCQATAAARVDGGPRGGTAARRVLPRRLHPPGGARPDRLAEPAGGLRPAVPGRRRDLAADRRRSRSTSGPRSASWPSCTPGARTSSTTPTSTASSPAAGSSPDGSRWVACRPGFFLPVRVLSRVFRGKFLALLRAAFDRGKLSFHGKLAALADPGEFQRRLAASARTEWVVYAKPPFGGPEQVLKYLARYTHRVAISNQPAGRPGGRRGHVPLEGLRPRGKQKTMTLKAIEFIRRFLLHVLPAGFVRIRHYGFLANRVCREKLALCRALLAAIATARSRRGRARPRAERRPSKDEPAATRLPRLRRGPDGHHRDLRGDPGRAAGSSQAGADPPSGRDSTRPEPIGVGRERPSDHRRRDRPWR